MTTDELRLLISSGKFKIEKDVKEICSGKINSLNGQSKTYVISHGWDLITANEIDQLWGSYNLSLLEEIEQMEVSDEKRLEIIRGLKFEDSHWNWFKKSFAYSTDEYEWFFLFIDDKPQGACLFYHPKNSSLGTYDIFYIEYIAVAPWNRNTGIRDREYKGIGSSLLYCACDYARNDLSLSQGFSLHSLPQATSFYKMIGMVHIPENDKEVLQYFEMPPDQLSRLEDRK
jgi:hypothetical protein